jgi:hypothetical protein
MQDFFVECKNEAQSFDAVQINLILGKQPQQFVAAWVEIVGTHINSPQQ